MRHLQTLHKRCDQRCKKKVNLTREQTQFSDMRKKRTLMDFLRELRSYERYKLIEPLSCNPCIFASLFSSEFVKLFRLIGQRRSSFKPIRWQN